MTPTSESKPKVIPAVMLATVLGVVVSIVGIILFAHHAGLLTITWTLTATVVVFGIFLLWHPSGQPFRRVYLQAMGALATCALTAFILTRLAVNGWLPRMLVVPCLLTVVGITAFLGILFIVKVAHIQIKARSEK